ncbi:MAG: hypothetical protein MUF21_14170, partial [Gemmatimonadaceae bacterium]|nr:hypothetical protein [Gemmatimonadaceae bacterium]
MTWFASHWADVLKYLGLVSTVGYGLYATVVDFHVEVDGRKRLSRGGRVGIVLLVLGGLVGMAVQWHTDDEDAERRRADLATADSLVRAQRAVLDRLAEQLASLRALDAMARRSETLAGAQLVQQGRVLDQQGRLVAEQRVIAFNGVRLLQPLPRVTSVAVDLDAAWDPSLPRDSSDHRSPRAYADLARGIVDTVCAQWSATARDTPLGRFVSDSGDTYTWQPSRGASGPGRRDVYLARAGVHLFGAAVAGDGRCTADSLWLLERSGFLRADPRLRYQRMGVLRLGDHRITLRIREPDADTTSLLVLYAGVDADTLRRHRRAAIAFAADFGRARLRWHVHEAQVTDADTAVDRSLSLLDLPGRRVVVDPGRPATRVTRAVIRFERGRTLTLAGGDITHDAHGHATHVIRRRDIERTPGEFGGLFADAPPVPADAPEPRGVPRGASGAPRDAVRAVRVDQAAMPCASCRSITIRWASRAARRSPRRRCCPRRRRHERHRPAQARHRRRVGDD